MNLSRTLSLVFVSSIFGAAAFGGCAQNEDDGGLPDATADVQEDVVSDEEDVKDTSPPKDAGKKETGTKDSGIKDAGYQDTGAEGTPCPPSVFSEDRYCGWCGKDSRVCLNQGGTLVWGPWGGCKGTKENTPNACDPYVAHPSIDCGNCGKITQTCVTPGIDGECTYLEDATDCVEPFQPGTTEPACKPDSTRFKVGASCPGPNEGRLQTCNQTCVWGAFSATCTTPTILPLSIDIPGTVSATTVKAFTLDLSVTAGRLKSVGSNSCPNTVDSATIRPYQYISVRNPTNKTATVSLWTSGEKTIDTVLAWYDSPSPPSNDTERENCKGSTIDNCVAVGSEPAPPFCTGQLRAVADRLTIPANGGFVTLYVQLWNASLPTGVSNTYNLTVRTESLN